MSGERRSTSTRTSSLRARRSGCALVAGASRAEGSGNGREEEEEEAAAKTSSGLAGGDNSSCLRAQQCPGVQFDARATRK